MLLSLCVSVSLCVCESVCAYVNNFVSLCYQPDHGLCESLYVLCVCICFACVCSLSQVINCVFPRSKIYLLFS